MQELEYALCTQFKGFNLYNLDNTDIETLIPFIQYVNLKNSKKAIRRKGIIYKNGKQYKKVSANASWVNSIF